jgi:hypothetical protein
VAIAQQAARLQKSSISELARQLALGKDTEGTRLVLQTKLRIKTPPRKLLSEQQLNGAPGEIRTCPFRKSYQDVLMMQSGQDGNGDNDSQAIKPDKHEAINIAKSRPLR